MGLCQHVSWRSSKRWRLKIWGSVPLELLFIQDWFWARSLEPKSSLTQRTSSQFSLSAWVSMLSAWYVSLWLVILLLMFSWDYWRDFSKYLRAFTLLCGPTHLDQIGKRPCGLLFCSCVHPWESSWAILSLLGWTRLILGNGPFTFKQLLLCHVLLVSYTATPSFLTSTKLRTTAKNAEKKSERLKKEECHCFCNTLLPIPTWLLLRTDPDKINQEKALPEFHQAYQI